MPWTLLSMNVEVWDPNMGRNATDSQALFFVPTSDAQGKNYFHINDGEESRPHHVTKYLKVSVDIIAGC